jgi:glutamate synthase (NADPH/NADH) small chain
MRQEGVTFRTGVHVGRDLSAQRLLDDYDAVVLTGGAEQPRDLPVPGRELDGVHFAMQFLEQQNRRVVGDTVPANQSITARDKHVIVIGGGDTGSDCIGTSIRQGARSVTQIEILPKPPETPDKGTIWPYWPNRLRTSSSQAEGVGRDWNVATKELRGAGGKVKSLHAIRVDWQQDAQGRWQMKELPEQTLELKADLVLLAMGFVHPVHAGLLEELGVTRDTRGNVAADTEKYQTSIPRCSPPAICGAGSRWWCGPSARDARPRTPSINF